MRVKFVRAYFAPGYMHKGVDGRVISGSFFAPGVYEDVPDDMTLPKDAKRLDQDEPAESVKTPPVINPHGKETLHAYDEQRQSAEAVQRLADQADAVIEKRGRGRPRKHPGRGVSASA